MEFKLIKTLWGVPSAGDTSTWDALFKEIKNEGFSGIESIGLTWKMDPVLFKELLLKHNLALVLQIHTAGGYIENGEYIYCSSNKIDVHVASFRTQLMEALEMGAVMVNSHSGHDSWDLSTAVSYFEQTMKIEHELLQKDSKYRDVIVVHETHRQRLMYSPYQTRDILAHPSMNQLRINADLSHWVCVCEHVFESTGDRDDWWPSLLETVADHCHFIHARVGHAEGPQVFDPRNSSEYKNEIDAHLSWWKAIFMKQKARGQAICYVEPEACHCLLHFMYATNS